MRRDDFLQSMSAEFDNIPGSYSSYWKMKIMLDYIEKRGMIPPSKRRLLVLSTPEEGELYNSFLSNFTWERNNG